MWKKYQKFLSENFHFLVIKFSVYLNRHVFVMVKRPSEGNEYFGEDSTYGSNKYVSTKFPYSLLFIESIPDFVVPSLLLVIWLMTDTRLEFMYLCVLMCLTLTPYHIYPKLWIILVYSLLMCLKDFWANANRLDPDQTPFSAGGSRKTAPWKTAPWNLPPQNCLLPPPPPPPRAEENCPPPPTRKLLPPSQHNRCMIHLHFTKKTISAPPQASSGGDGNL